MAMSIAKELIGDGGWNGFVLLENKVEGWKKIIPLKNIVTNEGDKFYAQSACGEVPTYAFGSLYLGTTGSSAPGKTSDYSDLENAQGEKAVTATYPKTNDADPDNTSADVDTASWLFEYTVGDGPFTSITDGMICEAGAGGTDPCLCHFEFGAPWSKDGSTSAKVFVDHNFLGI